MESTKLDGIKTYVGEHIVETLKTGKTKTTRDRDEAVQALRRQNKELRRKEDDWHREVQKIEAITRARLDADARERARRDADAAARRREEQEHELHRFQVAEQARLAFEAAEQARQAEEARKLEQQRARDRLQAQREAERQRLAWEELHRQQEEERRRQEQERKRQQEEAEKRIQDMQRKSEFDQRQEENRRLEQERKSSSATLRHLRELIRDRCQRDIRIWSLRHVTAECDRAIVIRLGEESDAILDDIYRIVDGWNDESIWDQKEELPTVKEIVDCLATDKPRVWSQNPPWEKLPEDRQGSDENDFSDDEEFDLS